jgi:2-polyprenyl-3-methyl-5-hydroxy-6-metoxy-1,4-benzoquinol methylase
MSKSTIKLEDVVRDINQRNKNTVFPPSSARTADAVPLVQQLLEGCTFLDHGASTMAFLEKSQNHVLKFSDKWSETRSSLATFVDYTKSLIDKGLPVLPVEPLWENDDFIVYRQVQFKTVSHEFIRERFSRDFLQLLLDFLNAKIMLHDIHYKDVGYYRGKMYISDYTDKNLLDEPDYRFNICSTYDIITYNLEVFVPRTSNPLEIEAADFYAKVIPEPLSKLLRQMWVNFSEAHDALKCAIEYLNTMIPKAYDIYQHFTTDANKGLILRDHTAEKGRITHIACDMMQKDKKDFTLLDAGCAIGGLGISVAINYPESNVTLNNITLTELQIAAAVATELHIDVEFSGANITSYSKRHDVCLYFAIFHHILKSTTFEDVIKIIKRQCAKYAVIELPVQGDVLLNMVLKNVSGDAWSANYKNLLSEQTLHNALSEHFDVVYSSKVDYKNHELLRHAYICKIRE